MSCGTRMGSVSVWRMRRFVALVCGTMFLLVGLTSASVSAKDVRIVTWNVHAAFTPELVAKRAEKLLAMSQVIKPDVLLVQEVASIEAVAAVRDAMGLKGYYIACSDFNQNDKDEFASLEVGIISRYPLSQVIEYDPVPDNVASEGDPDELPLLPHLKLGIKKPEGEGRGFLWARIDDLELTVAVVHLKSSRGVDGAEDAQNAVIREFVTAAVATSVIEDQLTWPHYSSLVAGDFNVGHSDKHKNGHDLKVDSLDPNSGEDLYDDTHALLADGIVGGMKMKNLVLHHMGPTFPGFPSTPIDNIYVIGQHESAFTPAVVSEDGFGSDHRPVYTTLSSDTAPADDVAAAEHPLVPAVSPGVSGSQGTLLAKADDKPKKITPAEAKDHVGEDCLVEMTVEASRLLKERNTCLLNSEKDFRSEKNFTVVIFETGLNSFKDAGIDDPAEHFKGKKIAVTGKIAQRDKQYQIVVTDRKQIEVGK